MGCSPEEIGRSGVTVQSREGPAAAARRGGHRGGWRNWISGTLQTKQGKKLGIKLGTQLARSFGLRPALVLLRCSLCRVARWLMGAGLQLKGRIFLLNWLCWSVA